MHTHMHTNMESQVHMHVQSWSLVGNDLLLKVKIHLYFHVRSDDRLSFE